MGYRLGIDLKSSFVGLWADASALRMVGVGAEGLASKMVYNNFYFVVNSFTVDFLFLVFFVMKGSHIEFFSFLP